MSNVTAPLSTSTNALHSIDLENGHSEKQEFPAYKKLLFADQGMSKEKCGSVEEQVAVLIAHASDANILGRTWQGWEPWV